MRINVYLSLALIFLFLAGAARADFPYVATPVQIGEENWMYKDVGAHVPSDYGQGQCYNTYGSTYFIVALTAPEFGNIDEGTWQLSSWVTAPNSPQVYNTDPATLRVQGSEACHYVATIPVPAAIYSYTGAQLPNMLEYLVGKLAWPGNYLTTLTVAGDNPKLLPWTFRPEIGTPFNPGPAGTIIFVHHNETGSVVSQSVVGVMNYNVQGRMMRYAHNIASGGQFTNVPVRLVGGDYPMKWGPTADLAAGTFVVRVRGGRASTYHIYSAGPNPRVEEDPCNINPNGCVQASPSPSPTPTPTPGPTPTPVPSPSPGATPTPSPSPSPDPANDQTKPDWWTDMLKKAFVPQQSSIDGVNAAWSRLSTWGPFGFAPAIMNSMRTFAASCSHIDTPNDTCGPVLRLGDMDWCKPFGGECGSYSDQAAVLDFRPYKPEPEQPYPGGGRGSIVGGAWNNFRRFALGPLYIILAVLSTVRHFTAKPTT